MHRHATAGFAVALQVGPHAPRFLMQTFPRGWIADYAAEGLARSDPAMAWGRAHEGRIGWDILSHGRATPYFDLAARHGLTHGATIAVAGGGHRSIGSFARQDRPFRRDEEEALAEALGALHALTLDEGALDPAQRETLRRLSVAFSRG